MGRRYFIELSRKDVGMVSYFPGLEVKDAPEDDWIYGVLVPAVAPLANRKSAKVRELPITFWISVRGTARRRAEIFLFVAPAYPGAVIEQAMSRALQPLDDGNVHAGREPIPEDAVPILQVFRRKLIRFYGAINSYEGFCLPTVQWKDNALALALLSIPEDDELMTVNVPIEEAEQLLVEARILPASDGESCRRFQQALIRIAREVQ